MSNRTAPSKVMSMIRETRNIAFSFAPNGASNPLLSAVIGFGPKSIVHSATGVWTLTMIDNWFALISAQMTLAISALTPTCLQWGAINVAAVGGATLVIRGFTSNTAGAADIAANAANRIYIELFVQNEK